MVEKLGNDQVIYIKKFSFLDNQRATFLVDNE